MRPHPLRETRSTNLLQRRRAVGAMLAATAGAVGWPLLVRAQTSAWPDRPIKLIVGFPAGTSPDLKARLLAEPLTQLLGQPVVVENRVGAAGSVGAEAVARATDDHSFGVIGSAALTSTPILNPGLAYKPAQFKPISMIGTSPLLLVAGANLGFSAATDFFAQARAAGNKWNYGSIGIGSSTHLAGELLASKAGLDAVHVPFNGAPAVINAMIGGAVQFATLPIGAALAQAQAGRIKAIAITSAARSVLAPGVAALPEVGVPSLNLEIWNAVLAPASISSMALERFSRALSAVIRSDDVRQKLFAQGWQADGGSPEALAQRIRDDTAVFGAIITQRKITLNS